MTTPQALPPQASAPGRTVQDYIDETPAWADATPVRDAPMTAMQWLIWGLAAAGKFFEGMVVFTTGVALPLMTAEFGLGATENGVIAAASLFGILIGATVLGGLADRYGRKEMFIVEMVLFAVFVVLLTLSTTYLLVVVALVGIGLALGCDYPTAHLMISESIPSRIRGRMVLSAFGFQAVGGLAGTAIGFLILYENPDIGAWRWMYSSTLVLAVPVIIGRFFIVQSPSWLVVRGRLEEAEEATERLLLRDPPYPKDVVLHRPQGRDKGHGHSHAHWSALFKGKNLDRNILASVPWFLQDLGTYGIGIFTPTILATIIGARIDHPRNTAELIQSDILATQGAALIDVLLDRGHRIRCGARGPRGPHPPPNPRFHRLCRGAAGRGAVAACRRNAVRAAAVRRLYAVQLHDQRGAQCDDLPDCGRGVPGFNPRHRGGFCRFVRQDWSGPHRFSVSNPAQGYRHRPGAADPGRHQPSGRSRHLALRG
jgi:MFS family permease